MKEENAYSPIVPLMGTGVGGRAPQFTGLTPPHCLQPQGACRPSPVVHGVAGMGCDWCPAEPLASWLAWAPFMQSPQPPTLQPCLKGPVRRALSCPKSLEKHQGPFKSQEPQLPRHGSRDTSPCSWCLPRKPPKWQRGMGGRCHLRDRARRGQGTCCGRHDCLGEWNCWWWLAATGDHLTEGLPAGLEQKLGSGGLGTVWGNWLRQESG